jgi:hypothetical protein
VPVACGARTLLLLLVQRSSDMYTALSKLAYTHQHSSAIRHVRITPCTSATQPASPPSPGTHPVQLQRQLVRVAQLHAPVPALVHHLGQLNRRLGGALCKAGQGRGSGQHQWAE